MSVVTILQMADRVSALMEQRLGLQGQDLAEKIARGGRRLPRRVRRAAGIVADAAEMAPHPRLQVRIDEEQVAIAYDQCLRYLGPLGRGARLRSRLVTIGLSVLAALLVGAGLLAWRGRL